jgi:YHS domain-containing protein
MTRHLIIFAACFLIGAVVTAAIRTVRHNAYEGHQGAHTVAPASTVDPHAGHTGAATPPAAPDSHAGHGGPAPVAPAATPAADPHAGHAMPAAPATGVPVNTICAICGMPVNPKLPTATYQGKTIGFGCKACPPKFAAEPERYGPAALKNQVVEE